MKKELMEDGHDLEDFAYDLDDKDLKKYQNEFLFQIFKLLTIGGEYNQYEYKIDDYREITKEIYKNTVE